MYCYGEFERELEERTGHSIEDFMDDDYFGETEEEEEDEDDCVEHTGRNKNPIEGRA